MRRTTKLSVSGFVGFAMSVLSSKSMITLTLVST